MNIPIDKVLEAYSEKDLRTFARIIESLKENKRTVDAAMRHLKNLPERPHVPTTSANVNLKHIRKWGAEHKQKIRVFRRIGRDSLRTTFKTMKSLYSNGMEFEDLESYIRRGN